MKVYLAGSIEHSPDGGRDWRKLLTPFLEGVLGHSVYDPAEDEQKNLTEEELGHFRSWKVADPQRFRSVIRKIIDYDLAILNSADYVICYWDSYASLGGGTQGELTFARHRRIPVYLVRAVDLERISGWVIGCADEIFSDFGELENHLIDIFASAMPRRRQAEDV
jgi:nucleoside 2-deoxyribosyltransferase